jgi:hypothetical protein
MKLNKFLWDIYKLSEQGQKAIQLFTNGPTDELIKKYLGVFHLSPDDTTSFIDDLIDFTTLPTIPTEMNFEEAGQLFESIISSGIELTNEDGEKEKYDPKTVNFLALTPIISNWLFTIFPDFYKPYFFRNRFQLLIRIADTFGIDLPPVPLKRYKQERIKYYWELCKTFLEFQIENELTAAEFCAFLYDFAPNYVSQSDTPELELPKPTQVWMVGGDKGGGDFEFLDKSSENNISFWQGNQDTKRGDIIVMYCLAPRSYIHSIWRATSDGIADPFFHWYSNIYIGQGKKVVPVTLNELKQDTYFSNHPLVRKNLQGVNGYPLTSEDYNRLQQIIIEKGGNNEDLPQLYSHTFSTNQDLSNEREVEIALIEPLLLQLGYTANHWVRQLSVRMGRGERNFPDYAFLTNKEQGYEAASMLIESKFWIKNNKELEETFKQVWSYGQRLMSNILVIADKDAIWIYERHSQSFDRTRYIKKFWKELEQPDNFQQVKQILKTKK